MKLHPLHTVFFALILFACGESSEETTPIEKTVNIEEEITIENSDSSENTEAKITNIRTNYNEIEEGINDFELHSRLWDNGYGEVSLKAYYKDSELVKLVRSEAQGHGANETSYYLKDNVLFFIFETSAEEASVNGPFTYREMRVYIADNTIIRILKKERTTNEMATEKMDKVENKEITNDFDNLEGELANYEFAFVVAEHELHSFLPFSDFPPEIDGCSCYYSLSEDDFKLGQYVYMDDLGETAFVYLNNELTKLTVSDATGESSEHRVWPHGNYEIMIDMSETGTVDETWQKSGTITLKLEGEILLEHEIVGECGC